MNFIGERHRWYFSRFIGKIHYIWTNLTFRRYVIEKLVAGHFFHFEIANPVGKAWYDRNEPWPELSWVAEHMIFQGDCVVDCGVHHGLSLLVFAQCVGPSGFAVGIEANPSNAAVARRNLALNKFSNGEVVTAAAGDHSGETFISRHSNSAVVKFATARAIKAVAVTLDSIAYPKLPAFVKIDVEGHELAVLRGARQLLKNHPRIDLELHCCYYEAPPKMLSEIAAILLPLDYEWFVQEQVDGQIRGPVTLDLAAMLAFAKCDIVHLFGMPIKGLVQL